MKILEAKKKIMYDSAKTKKKIMYVHKYPVQDFYYYLVLSFYNFHFKCKYLLEKKKKKN